MNERKKDQTRVAASRCSFEILIYIFFWGWSRLKNCLKLNSPGRDPAPAFDLARKANHAQLRKCEWIALLLPTRNNPRVSEAAAALAATVWLPN